MKKNCHHSKVISGSVANHWSSLAQVTRSFCHRVTMALVLMSPYRCQWHVYAPVTPVRGCMRSQTPPLEQRMSAGMGWGEGRESSGERMKWRRMWATATLTSFMAKCCPMQLLYITSIDVNSVALYM